MRVEIKTTKIYDVKYIGFDIPIRNGDLEYDPKDDKIGKAYDEKNQLALKIELESGKVYHWEDCSLNCDFVIYSKAVDEGVYTLYDDNFNVISTYEGYVPSILSCIDDGYGDYLSMVISPDGIIENWNKNKINSFINTINGEE